MSRSGLGLAGTVLCSVSEIAIPRFRDMGILTYLPNSCPQSLSSPLIRALLFAAVLYDDAGGIYDHVVPPYAPTDDAPCNVGNRPGPGPPPAEAFAKPLRPGRHPLYDEGEGRGARLLTEAERAAGMAGRSPPMRAPPIPPLFQPHNSSNGGEGGDGEWDPPNLDGQTWALLNTFAGDGRTAPMDTFIGFALNDAPSGLPKAKEWMRVPYTAAKDAMPLEFHEVRNVHERPDHGGAPATRSRLHPGMPRCGQQAHLIVCA